jgi:four helix bundle protein
MSEIQSYRDLEAWQRAIELTLVAYALAERLPSTEKYELARQMRRAATSIPANVAEGYERRGKGYLHHVRIALGSLAELQTHVEVALRLEYLTADDVQAFVRTGTSAVQLLHGLRRSLILRFVTQTTGITTVLVLLFSAF